MRLAFEQRDVVGYGRCGDETGTPLGDRAQPTRADQLIDCGATQRQERHRFRDAVKLLVSLHGPPSWPSLWRQRCLTVKLPGDQWARAMLADASASSAPGVRGV